MLDREWLSTFVPIGHMADGQTWHASGAGVLLSHEGMIWLSTAAHVVTSIPDRRAVPIVTRTDGAIEAVALSEIHRSTGTGWFADETHDVAVSAFPISEHYSIKALPKDLCQPLPEALPSMMCFTLGCPYGMTGFGKRPEPMVQLGVISGSKEDNRTLYFTAPTFRGNSGGPLITIRWPFNAAGNVMTVGQSPLMLAGIVIQHASVEPEEADQPPIRLGVAASIDAVWALLESDRCRAEIQRLKAGAKQAK